MQEDINNIVKWVYDNNMQLNTAKTKCLIVSHNESANNICLTIKNDKIEIVNTLKYLGIIIDRKLKFSNHIDNIIHNIYNRLGHTGEVTIKNTEVFEIGDTVIEEVNLIT